MDICIDDLVFCKMFDGKIIKADAKEYDCILKFKIIGKRGKQYAVFVEADCPMNDKYTKFIDADLRSECMMGFDMTGYFCTFITKDEIFSKYEIGTNTDGMFCKRCREFYVYGAPNSEDGTMTCFSCRTYPYR